MPELVPVDSSSIARVGHDAARGELYVEFHGGRVYVYAGVPADTFRELLDAESKGGYFNREIKPDHDWRRL